MQKPRINGTVLLVYLLGHIILACGVCLNTKTFLGVSPVISVAYNASQILGVPIGPSTFVYSMLLIVIQYALLGKRFDRFQFLQIFAAFLGSFFLQIFDSFLSLPGHLFWRFLSLLIGLILTGIGASLTVGMKILPHPADALAHTIGLVCHRSFGFGKNLLDTVCILTAASLGLLFKQSLLGIGFGTLVAVFMTGRVIAVCHPWTEQLYQKISHSAV